MIDKADRATRVLALARAQNAIITTAESCTGGLVSAALTEIAGSSDVFDRGFATYSNAAKQEMLGVSPETLDRFGAVSQKTAQEMAIGAIQNSNATLAVSITGIAGPGGSDHKPEGMVCFSVCQIDQHPKSETILYGALGRENVRQAAMNHALDLLIGALSHDGMP